MGGKSDRTWTCTLRDVYRTKVNAQLESSKSAPQVVPDGPPNSFSALCGNRVGFRSDEVQALCDEILPPLSLMGEVNSLEASGSDASELP